MILEAYNQRLLGQFTTVGAGMSVYVSWATIEGATSKVIDTGNIISSVPGDVATYTVLDLASTATQTADPNRMRKVLTIQVRNNTAAIRPLQFYVQRTGTGWTGTYVLTPAFSLPIGGMLYYSPETGWLVYDADGKTLSVGSTGATGSTGLAGPMGAILFAEPEPGEDGAPGQQGPIGPVGPTGATGATGATGPQGVMGTTGPLLYIEAEPGEDGMIGPIGLTGATGATGSQGIQGPVGAAVYLAADRGDDGDIGPPGPIGAIGPQGATGSPGPQGQAGAAIFLDADRGDDGDVGPPGPQGPQGAQGLQGIQGATGITGAVLFMEADAGDDGMMGPVGLTGPQGLQGITGSQGPMGPVVLPDMDPFDAEPMPLPPNRTVVPWLRTPTVPAVAAQAITAATLTKITGSELAPREFVVGQTYLWTITGDAAAAGTAANSIFVRIGTNNTTADAAVATFTTAVGTAATSQFMLQIVLPVRTLGAAATAYAHCTISNSAAAGFVNIGTSVLLGSMATFNSTTASQFVHVSLTTGASKTANIQTAFGEVTAPSNALNPLY